MGKPTGRKVAIIGTGIAGLTAAELLVDNGWKVTLYEARSRPGGRINTDRHGKSGGIVELGAEFIHGMKNETWTRFRGRRGFCFAPVLFPDRHWQFQNGTLEEHKNFWEDLDFAFRTTGKADRDRSFCAYVRGGKIPFPLRQMAEDFVAGFHGARLSQIGIKALEKSNEAAEKSVSEKQFTLRHGYGPLIDQCVKNLRKKGAQFYFGTPVTRVEWRRGAVALYTRRKLLETTDKVLLTVPLGVLQAKRGQPGAIIFNPPLPAKARSLSKFRMGNVIKLILVFRKRCWPGKYFGFIHAHGCSFPTLWMARGSRQIVAWAGGDQTDPLSGSNQSELTTLALRQLSRIFDVQQSLLKASLSKSYWHDWSSDPFSRGAYSFPAPGGVSALKTLKQPIQDTLFFAGELFAPSGQEGTVHGAAASARLAVGQILETT